MLVIQVHIKVKAESLQEFLEASLANARSSLQEPGIARFDVLQDATDPTGFVLIEVYRTAQDPAAHKETAHYRKWRDTVADMMEEPRISKQFTNVFPPDEGW